MTDDRCILAFDQGTSSSRAIVFRRDAKGVLAPIASAQREFAQHFPAPGLVEHDALEIWTTSLDCAREAIVRAGISSAEIAAIGITNQRETILVWDRATGAPIHRAIVWQDRRTAPALAELRRAGREQSVRAATGLTLDPYFSASKLAWILDAVPGARARAERGELAAGTIDSWLLWNLTRGAVHATDASNASRTMLARIGGPEGAAWDDALCELFRVPRAILPRIVDSCGVVASSDPAVLGAPVAIAGIAGDQQAALFGQRCLRQGDAKCTYGTGCFLLANAGESLASPPDGLLATVAWRIGATTTYAVEGGVFIGGSAVQWLRDGMRFFERAGEVNALAASVADSGGVVVVPSFAGLGAPWWDADARGAVLGLTRGSTKAHVARATLEGIAHQVADLVEAIERGGVTVSALRVDGGAAASNPLMQMQADLLARPVERPLVLETTALGAALLAEAGISPGKSAESRASAAEDGIAARFVPAISAEQRGRARERWRRAVDTVRAFGSPA
jgi:glycerol kinase